MHKGLVRACHDCSEGGLAVSAAEMAFAGNIGATLRLAEIPRTPDVPTSDDGEAITLFSETSSRFLVQVSEQDAASFEAEMGNTTWACVGETGGDVLLITGFHGQTTIQVDLARLKAAWQGGSVAPH
jgi:phosphoribosylformylglycinamidine synthase